MKAFISGTDLRCPPDTRALRSCSIAHVASAPPPALVGRGACLYDALKGFRVVGFDTYRAARSSPERVITPLPINMWRTHARRGGRFYRLGVRRRDRYSPMNRSAHVRCLFWRISEPCTLTAQVRIQHKQKMITGTVVRQPLCRCLTQEL